MKEFTVAYSMRNVTFQTNRFQHRGHLGSAIRRGEVLAVDVHGVFGRARKQYLNLGLVERIL